VLEPAVQSPGDAQTSGTLTPMPRASGRSRFVIASAATVFLGCGLSVVGSATDLGDASTSPTPIGADDSGAKVIDAARLPDGAIAPCPSTCDDPAGAGACQNGTTCSPIIPLGWRLVAVSEDPKSACSGDFPTADPAAALVAPAVAGATCTCACGKVSDGQCTGGGKAEIFWSDGAGCDKSAGSVTADGSCHALDVQFKPVGDFSIKAVPTQALPTCGTTANVVVPSADGGAVVSCAASSPFACEGHRRCISKPAGANICVAKDFSGSALPPACPDGFKAKTFTAATSLNDTRGCGDCTCSRTPATCSIDNFTLSSLSDCSNNTYSNGSKATACSTFDLGGNPAPTFKGLRLGNITGSAGGSCGTGTAAATGAVSAAAGYAVCCAD